jgi:hypothetical protein
MRHGVAATTLIDLISNTDGTCKDAAVAFAEGTARTNLAMMGKTNVEDLAEIHFDVGVPHAQGLPPLVSDMR